MYKSFIFDFDGTLADTKEAFIEVTNSLSTEFGFPKITPEKSLELQNKSAKELIKHFNISPIKLPLLMIRAKKELGAKIPEVKPFPHLAKVLKELKAKGIILGIVTSNSVENVQAFLKNNKLEFDFVDSELELFGKGRKIKKVLKKHQIAPDEALYIGDEVRDIEASRDAGVKVVAVTWGFNSKKALIAAWPDFVVDTPEELLKII